MPGQIDVKSSRCASQVLLQYQMSGIIYEKEYLTHSFGGSSPQSYSRMGSFSMREGAHNTGVVCQSRAAHPPERREEEMESHSPFKGTP